MGQQNETFVVSKKKIKQAGIIVGVIAVVGFLFLANSMLSSTSATNGNSIIGAAAANSGNVQEIIMSVNGAAYLPSTLTVSAGKSVKWLVDGTGATGCTTYLLAPELGISKKLNKGTNTIEFTAPAQKGTYEFSCSMGMVKGTLNVI